MTAELDPDELRLGRPADRRGAGRAGGAGELGFGGAATSPRRARCSQSNRRIARGDEVTLGRLGRGSSVVAAARAIRPRWARSIARSRRAGVAWRYGAPRSIAPATTDSGAARRPGAGAPPLPASSPAAAGAPACSRPSAERPGWCGAATWCCWAAGSIRPGPTCRSRPASCRSWMLLLNRLARGEVSLADGAPGDPMPLPDLVTEVRQGERELAGGGRRRASVRRSRGAYYLLAGTRHASGAISANLDPRESLLGAGAATARCGGSWQGRAGRVARPTLAARPSRRAARGDLRGPLLWAALRSAWRRWRSRAGWRRQRDEAQAGPRRLRALARRRSSWPGGCRPGARRCGWAACRAPAAPCWPPGWRAAFRQRLLAIVAPTPGDAERWLTDLAHLTDGAVALYPAARGAGRGRAALRDRRRAGRDDRGAAARAAPDPGDHRARHGGADPDAGRAGAAAAPARRGRAPPAGRRGPRRSSGWDTAGCRRSPRSPSSACAAASSTCTASAWRRRPGWSGGATTSRPSAGSISPPSARCEELSEITVLPISTRRIREDGERSGSSERPARGAGGPAPARRTLLELLPSDTLVIEEAAGPDATR